MYRDICAVHMCVWRSEVNLESCTFHVIHLGVSLAGWLLFVCFVFETRSLMGVQGLPGRLG